MIENLKNQLLEQLINDDEIIKELKVRKISEYRDSVPSNSILLNELLNDGWEIATELKTKTKVIKQKPLDIDFKDKIWSLLAYLGFTSMNRESNFKLPFEKRDEKLFHQFDVFAKDNETILLVDCKSANKNKIGDFTNHLQTIKIRKAGIVNTIKTMYPGTKPKIKYILATRNLAIGPQDEVILNDIDGIHFTEETIDYYSQLQLQLGSAARYQLLGSLFAGSEIPDIDNRIPAIEGKMGGHTYYSFSIEPEKLLKIGYVLHRNKANENLMPTYQRLIKKARLKQIETFVDEQEGYFPNSIIINIVTSKNKGLIFDRSSNQVENSISRIGILHLPKKYRSAYIIDGQHRLYGYANSKFKSTNTIPVVALVNLAPSEQVKLFMQINENQKAVSKDLRNTLNSDLLWDSNDLTERMKALKSRIAINLGDNRKSPLYDRISIGEDKKEISTQQIGLALSKTDFLGKVKAKEIEKLGTFFSGDFEKSFETISDFLFRSYYYLKNSLEELWESEGNIILINKGFFGITLVLNDLVNHVTKNNLIEFPISSKNIFEAVKPFLDTIIHFYKEIDEEKTIELRKAYGTPGDVKYWRTLQLALRGDYKEIHCEGLDDYLKKEERENNELAFKLIREIENTFFKVRIKERLEDEFGKNWFKKGVPEKIYTDAINMAAKKNREIENEEDEKEPWDQLHLIDYREIVLKNWQKIFEKQYTRPGEEKMQGGKESKTSWMVELNRIRNENYHTYYVTEDELIFIQKIHNWLIKCEI